MWLICHTAHTAKNNPSTSCLSKSKQSCDNQGRRYSLLSAAHTLSLSRAACMGSLAAVKPNWHANRVMIHFLQRNERRSGLKITHLCWAQGQSTQNCTQHKQATHTSTATRGDQALTPCLHPLPQARPCHIPTRTTQLLVCTWAAGSVTHAQINPQHKAGK